jgi:hypothetical protein
MIPIRTLPQLAYMLIDIIIYALGNMSWSSAIFWMVGRIVTDPSLGLLSPCEGVRQVLILVSWGCWLEATEIPKPELTLTHVF